MPDSESGWTRPALFGPALLVLAASLSWHFAGYRMPSADEGAILTNAAKLLRGALWYRDVDAYPFPLAPHLLALAFAGFGEQLVVARALAALFYCVVTLSLYGVALQLMSRRRAALFGLALLSLKFFAYPSFTSYSYWDVSFAFACLAILLLVRHPFRGPTPQLVAAGLMAGLALVAKQNLGIYLAGVAGILLLFSGPLLGVRREGPRTAIAEAAAFGAGCLAPFALMAGAFAAHGLLPTMIRSGLLAPFIGYANTSAIPFGVPLAWWNFGALTKHPGVQYQPEPVWQLLSNGWLPGASWYEAYWLLTELFLRLVYTSIPLAFLAALLYWLTHRGRAADRELTIVAALAGPALLSALPRADWGHIVSVYPVVGLVIVALMARSRWRATTFALQGVVTAALLAGAAFLTFQHHAHLDHRVELERAAVWVSPHDWTEQIVRDIDDKLDDDDALLVYGPEAQYYFLSGRFFPWRFAQLYPGQAGYDQGVTLFHLLNLVRPPMVVRGLVGLPGLPSLPDYTPFLDAQLSHTFRLDEEVFERWPMTEGGEPPPWWVLSVLAPCEVPIDECDTWFRFAWRQPPLPFDPREVEEMEREKREREGLGEADPNRPDAPDDATAAAGP